MSLFSTVGARKILFTHVDKLEDRDTHTHAHLSLSRTCQSCLPLTGRRKGGWEMQQFVGLEQLVSVDQVGLSIHVQRQRLSDSLFSGWWAWVLRTEGFWHCVNLWSRAYFCTQTVHICVHVCIACWESVGCSWAEGFLGLPELLHSPLWQRGSGTSSYSSPLLFQRGEATKAAEPWKSLWLNCQQKASTANFTVEAMNHFLFNVENSKI